MVCQRQAGHQDCSEGLHGLTTSHLHLLASTRAKFGRGLQFFQRTFGSKFKNPFLQQETSMSSKKGWNNKSSKSHAKCFCDNDFKGRVGLYSCTSVSSWNTNRFPFWRSLASGKLLLVFQHVCRTMFRFWQESRAFGSRFNNFSKIAVYSLTLPHWGLVRIGLPATVVVCLFPFLNQSGWQLNRLWRSNSLSLPTVREKPWQVCRTHDLPISAPGLRTLSRSKQVPVPKKKKVVLVNKHRFVPCCSKIETYSGLICRATAWRYDPSLVAQRIGRWRREVSSPWIHVELDHQNMEFSREKAMINQLAEPCFPGTCDNSISPVKKRVMSTIPGEFLSATALLLKMYTKSGVIEQAIHM